MGAQEADFYLMNNYLNMYLFILRACFKNEKFLNLDDIKKKLNYFYAVN